MYNKNYKNQTQDSFVIRQMPVHPSKQTSKHRALTYASHNNESTQAFVTQRN